MPPTAADIPATLKRIPIGVAIITTEKDGVQHGSTGMAWAEDPEPPMLLTTVRRTGTTRRLIVDQQRFGISLLAAAQSALTWQFADRTQPAAKRFAGTLVVAGPVLGIPLLRDALASFECTLHAVYPFGQYDIVVGNVVWANADLSASNRPVIHYGDQLWQLTRAA